jgi:RecB family exonuclease
MKKILLALVFSMAAFAQEKLTVYVDKMDGLEPAVEKALKDAELPFTFIEELDKPDLKVQLAKMHSGAYAEILYKKVTGRNEDHRLEMVDVKTGKAIASYQFRLDPSPEVRARIAADFAARVKAKVKK